MQRISRRTVNAIATLIAMLSLTGWALVFAYASWLRFSSPRLPNAATRQTVYEKAVKGGFYITPAQALWAKDDLLPIWLIFALAVIVANGTRDKTLGAPGRWSRSLRIAALAWAGLLLALFFAGDHVLALVLTGSLSVPPPR